MNRLHLLTRSTPAKHEPASVLIRHFGTDGPAQDPAPSNLSLSAVDQAIVYQEMALPGWGPKVYGFFPSGRLEEWIDAHTLTVEEASTPSIRRDIARAYARVHFLDLPLRKRNLANVLAELKSSAARKEDYAAVLCQNGAVEGSEYANILRETDWSGELDWVAAQFQKHNRKIAPVTGDPSYSNVLVKNFDSDCRIMLIDYKTVHYGYRGQDLGGHLVERIYDKRLQLALPYFAEIHHLRPWLRYETLENPDTTRKLLAEAKFGMLYHILFSNLICFFGDAIPEDPKQLFGLTHMMQLYRRIKADPITPKTAC